MNDRATARRVGVAPATRFGRISVRLLGAWVCVLAFAVVVSQVDEQLVDSSTAYRLVVGACFMLLAIGSATTAAIAIVRDHDRSLLTALALLLGLLAAGIASAT